MRHYEHEIWRDDIYLTVDKRSSKAGFGTTQPEYMDSDDADFLREGEVERRNAMEDTVDTQLVFMLTQASPDGFHVVECQNFNGGYNRCGIHESKINWK